MTTQTQQAELRIQHRRPVQELLDQVQVIQTKTVINAQQVAYLRLEDHKEETFRRHRNKMVHNPGFPVHEQFVVDRNTDEHAFTTTMVMIDVAVWRKLRPLLEQAAHVVVEEARMPEYKAHGPV